MMKKLILPAFFLLFWVGLYAQDVLIPFRKDNQFGLQNQEGKVMLKPQFEELIWLTGKYFISTVKDKNQELHGLIYKDKELIKPLPNAIFRVIPEMMILGIVKEGDANSNKTSYELYNYKGEKIEPSGFGQLELINSFGKSKREPKAPKYALLFAKDFNEKTGIFLYNGDTSKIEKWLFKDAANFKVTDVSKDKRTFRFTYTASDGSKQLKELKTTDVDYAFKDANEEKIGEPIVGTDENALVESKAESTSTHQKNKKPLYSDLEGKLLFLSEGKPTEIVLNKDAKPIFKHTMVKNQAGNLIFQENKKYGLIDKGVPGKAIYDSLAYLGSDNYLVCQKTDLKLKCGVLDEELKTVIPMEYDSILGVMNQFEFVQKPNSQDYELEIKSGKKGMAPKEVSYVLPTQGNVVAYKNGKANWLKLNGSPVLPGEFDEIARNGMNLRGEVQTNFVVLKKDNLYGLILLTYDSEQGSNVQINLDPVFKYFPMFYINNYFEQPGKILIGLYDENGHFKAYASDFGVVYSN